LRSTGDMSDLSKIVRGFQKRTSDDSLSSRVSVAFDNENVCVRRVAKDGYPGDTARFAWDSILRTCFKDNGPMASDLIYLFVAGTIRPLTIPLECEGAGLLWRELRTRGIFPKTLHEQATLSTDGRLYCWPPVRIPRSTGG
jgi:hypothetical protein